MNAGFYASRIQTQVMRRREDVQFAYERYPDTTNSWALIDLVSSSNYRLLHGPAKGYVRGEMFLALVEEAVSANAEIEVLKEMGDAVLLMSSSLRPLVEACCLIDQVAFQLRSIEEDHQFPFQVRAGLTCGIAKQLNRPHKDFIGSPLDKLARLLSIRSVSAAIIVQEEAYKANEAQIEEYAEFLAVSQVQALSSELSKAMIEPIYYRELVVDRGRFVEYQNHFVAWRDL